MDGGEKSLSPVIEALSRTKSASSVVTVVVLPAGAFDASRREVEDRLGLSGKTSCPVHFTEDDEGGWTRTFGVSKTPSLYLINAKREFVWKHEGEPDPAALAAALDEFVIPTVPLGFSPIQMAVSPGECSAGCRVRRRWTRVRTAPAEGQGCAPELLAVMVGALPRGVGASSAAAR